MMLETASTTRQWPGWYRDPADSRSARFHDGNSWTGRAQPGAERLVQGHGSQYSPRARMSRHELEERAHHIPWLQLGKQVDVYL